MTVLSFKDASEQVKSGLDIVEIVSRHVVLKKTGRNYVGLCPFHNDKSPSMNVNREKNLFKCFSCGEGGDALTFLMKFEHKNFGDVIRDLASEKGIDIQEAGREKDPGAYARQKDQTEKILDLNRLACDWFKAQLTTPAAESVNTYLLNRQIHEPIQRQFQLGFAPPGWENLTRHLLQQAPSVQANPDLLMEAGLSNNRQEGQGHYDRFRNRLIIPILDGQGRIVAFGGRVLDAEDKPKYLNTPETSLYKKNSILYGLYQAKTSIRETKTAVVMEGYFDVISAHVGGISQAVGSCGTAITENHIKLLSRFGAETIYLAFDSDEAGLNAAQKAIELLEPYLTTSDLKVRVVVVPDDKDPDDYIRHHGGKAFQQLMDQAVSYLPFKFDLALKGLDFSSADGRVAAVNKITPILVKIGQPVLRAEMLKQYAERIGVSEEALALEVKRQAKSSGKQHSHQPYGSSGSYSKRMQTKQKYTFPGAIFPNARTSYSRKGSKARLSSPSVDRPLVRNYLAAEKDLLRLFFINSESYQIMSSLAPTLQIEDSLHQQLLNGIANVSCEAVTVEGLIRKLQHQFSEDPVLQKCLADCVFGAETLADLLEIESLAPQMMTEKIQQQAMAYQRVIAHHRAQQSLETMNHRVRATEEKLRKDFQIDQSVDQTPGMVEDDTLLALQYKIREQLAQGSGKHQSNKISNKQGQESNSFEASALLETNPIETDGITSTVLTPTSPSKTTPPDAGRPNNRFDKGDMGQPL
ncbi:MAG: DNA primase [Vampirovibrio sp.]|nr:DNA primase [Vampirovibrio sp.]